MPDVQTQIQNAKEEIIAAVIRKARDEGSYQHAKWLFEFGGITSGGNAEESGEVALARFLLERLQNPEFMRENVVEFSANDHAVE